MSRAELEYLRDHPVLKKLLDELEASALNQAVAAKLNDDESRRNLLAEVRAIRSVRQKLRNAVTLLGDTEA